LKTESKIGKRDFAVASAAGLLFRLVCYILKGYSVQVVFMPKRLNNFIVQINLRLLKRLKIYYIIINGAKCFFTYCANFFSKALFLLNVLNSLLQIMRPQAFFLKQGKNQNTKGVGK